MRADKVIRTTLGESLLVTNNWTAQADSRSTSISASTWSYTSNATLSSAALAANISTVLITATSSGWLTNTATLANGEVLLSERWVEVSTVLQVP